MGEVVTALFAVDAEMERGRRVPFKKRGRVVSGLRLKTNATRERCSVAFIS